MRHLSRTSPALAALSLAALSAGAVLFSGCSGTGGPPAVPARQGAALSLPAPPAGTAPFDADAFWAMPTNVPFSASTLLRGQDDAASWFGFMYTGEFYRGQPMRIFAWYARPRGDGPFPAVLSVHGAGGGADLARAREFAAAGYACLSIDWNAFNEAGPRWTEGDPLPVSTNTVYCGIWYKDWPAHFCAPAPDGDWKWCVLYRAIMASRRGIDWLGTREEVDATRIAAEGHSFGGFLVQLLAGIDPRVKAVVSSAAAGSWKSRFEAGAEGHLCGAGLSPEQGYEFLRRYDPACYAERIRAPILVRLAAADFFASPETLAEYWPLLPPDKTLEMMPGRNHRFHDVAARVEWFDRCFRDGPGFPAIDSCRLKPGKTCSVRLHAAGDLPVTHAEIAWTTSTNAVWKDREWCSAPLRDAGGGVWEGSFQPVATGAPLRWFAGVLDSRGRGASTLQGECALPSPGRPPRDPVRRTETVVPRQGTATAGPAARDATTLSSENFVLGASWDDDALHLSFDVRDTSPWRASGEPGARDAVSVRIAPENGGEPAAFPLELRWTPDAKGGASAVLRRDPAVPGPIPAAPAATVARAGAKSAAPGYRLDARIPWTLLGDGFHPVPGRSLALSARVEFGCCLAPERLAEVPLDVRLALGE